MVKIRAVASSSEMQKEIPRLPGVLVFVLMLLLSRSTTLAASDPLQNTDSSNLAMDPSIEKNWDLSKCTHLLRRTGFGATSIEISDCLHKGLVASVDDLTTFKDTTELENALAAQNYVMNGDRPSFNDLQRWWLYRMTYSPNQFEEKLALFWHNHFATAYSKVRDVQALLNQNKLFRRNALGNFRTMLSEVSKDPAMIHWLDNNTNRVGRPNENYAREVMELFTMGIGNYTETDVREAARALTGWQTNNGQFFFNQRDHDNKDKTFLGNTGNFNGEDVINIILQQDATAKFITRKFLTFFVYENPEPELVDSLADIFRRSDYDIKTLVKALLTSNAFYSKRAFLAQVKMPVEFVVGTLRVLGATTNHKDVLGPLTRMGMSIFNPPDVSGWDFNAAWVNTSAMIERYNFVNRLVSNRNPTLSSYFDFNALLAQVPSLESLSFLDHFLELLTPLGATPETRNLLLKYLAPETTNHRAETEPTLNVSVSAATTTADKLKSMSSERNNQIQTPQPPLPAPKAVPLSPVTLDSKGRGALYLIMTSPAYQLN